MQKAVDDLETQNEQLAALQAAQAAQRAASLALRKQKNGQLKKVTGNLALLEQQENQLLAESQTLGGVIVGAQGAGGGTGQLIWPVNAPVVSPFG